MKRREGNWEIGEWDSERTEFLPEGHEFGPVVLALVDEELNHTLCEYLCKKSFRHL
jgi:hypothetical protein